MNLAKDQLKRHADVLQAETLALERRIAFANEELAKKQQQAEVQASWGAAEGLLVPMFTHRDAEEARTGRPVETRSGAKAHAPGPAIAHA